MFNLKNRIYISTFVNSFGSWLTFIAIALITKEKYGADHVALVFLVQTLPAIIFSRGLVNLIPPAATEKVYVVTQVLLALCSFAIMIDQSLFAIYVFLFITSLLKSLSNPLNNSLIGKWIPLNEQKAVFTKVGALQAGTVALAPALGAWIKIFFSSNILFLIDGASFLISVLILKELFIKNKIVNFTNEFTFKWSKIIAGVSPKPGDIPQAVQKVLFVWFLFLAVGAILNAVEFPAFQRSGMSEQMIGYALASWGVGSLIAFLFSNRLSEKLSGLALVVVMSAFVFGSNQYLVISCFFMAGALTCYMSGSIRSRLQKSVPEGYPAAPVWAYANQLTQIINLVAYGSVGFLIGFVGLNFFGVALVAATVLLVFQAIKHEVLTKQA
ncbi:MAG: MFS transporter [Bdellovibrionaceae bacterium]|nr:MFS transporter [Bdellovibrio sp.]